MDFMGLVDYYNVKVSKPNEVMLFSKLYDTIFILLSSDQLSIMYSK